MTILVLILEMSMFVSLRQSVDLGGSGGEGGGKMSILKEWICIQTLSSLCGPACHIVFVYGQNFFFVFQLIISNSEVI
jgi:hypothetical protein